MPEAPVPLRLELWNGQGISLGPEPTVTIRARGLAGLQAVARSTLDALGEAYVEGEIDIEGALPDVIAVAADLAAQGGGDPARAAPASRQAHSRARDRAAIAYHYDVSNEFYAAWLDPRMVYSCAYFHDEADTLEQAQLQKIDHILTKLALRPGQRLLDIGCGWGALAIRAAERFGARVLGVTLSQQQYELARERVAAAGLAGRVEIRIEDYRDVRGQFDRITSVGMFEHVGLANLATYFRRMHALLADDGVALNHGITSTDPESRDSPYGGGDFIERYVFPDGELPHLGLVARTMAEAGLEVMDVENLRRHYALTCRHWAERFEAAGPRLLELAGEKRHRIWRVYLAGCAHAFDQGWVAIHQVLAVKQGATGKGPLPLTRDYMYGAGRLPTGH
ncbi:SAM-dependent methyltransferase [Chitinimonas koreensis]|uniref:SAM-dependent methyltransferase n=1 Tax=Chitinimonas koreensis TaxID=356302 RepID=UPI001FDF6E6D|nr:cyclopropane-fatty-acyl-phospholipid synthase family protein [Chitinimonas koreensis]